MKFKYRIRVFDYARSDRGIRTTVQRYTPERQEDTFIGRLCGWTSITTYSCDTEAEARQEIENDKVYMEVKYKRPKYKYIDVK
jgi:hypothetical protein